MSDDICAICLEKNAYRSLDCKHKYHDSCIESWFDHSKQNECPQCRKRDFSYMEMLNIKDENYSIIAWSVAYHILLGAIFFFA